VEVTAAACGVADHAFFLANLRLEQKKILPRERIAVLWALPRLPPPAPSKSVVPIISKISTLIENMLLLSL
jgi:hypothetical protein